MVKFANPEVAKRFQALREKDGHVHVPAGKERGSGYAGPLSTISLQAAEKLVASGSNLLKPIEEAASGNQKNSTGGNKATPEKNSEPPAP